MIHMYKSYLDIEGTKITSNPTEKLADHFIEHKINRRNDEGCNSQLLLCSSRSTFSLFSLLGHWFFLWFLLSSFLLAVVHGF